MGIYQACRVSLDVVAILVLLVGIILIGCGLFTPAWQVADLYELGEYHEHGLWQDCVKGWTRTAGPKSEFICYYLPLTNSDYAFQPFYNQEGSTYYQSQIQGQQMRERTLQSWRLAALALMAVAFGLGCFALFFGCCGTIFTCPAITWAVLTTLSTISGLIAVIVFAVNTTYPQNKFVLMTLNTAEMRLGRSYYYALAGVLVQVVASILSIACVVLLYIQHTKYLSGREKRLHRAKKYIVRAKERLPWPKQTSV